MVLAPRRQRWLLLCFAGLLCLAGVWLLSRKGEAQRRCASGAATGGGCEQEDPSGLDVGSIPGNRDGTPGLRVE